MPDSTDAHALVEPVASRHRVGVETALALLDALRAGGGRMAQFNLPELGGMGQWSRGGMVQVGDMFNGGLKARVDALCQDLAGLLREEPASRGAGGMSTSKEWWPEGLGRPSSTGGQNDVRYAVFPDSHRLAVERDGRVTVHDTGDHAISGVSQSQGGTSSLSFTSQHGAVRLEDLPEA